ncbi:hypothetical protein EUX98_g1394 [Antrodiella citrinella]|uniref:C2H2-type domain-containing protein n=1 Tax=Antrodiella citrinella TaxID=2447956 RepID=A0A4S4N1M4_9APHY|nr:hypothetical protein EUX98_g1394 [Antrodiella citrinella]
MRLWLWAATLLVAIFMSNRSLSCVPTCGKQYDTPRGLQIHKASCKVANAPDDDLLRLQQRLAEKRDRPRKRRRLEEPVPSVPDLNSPAPQDDDVAMTFDDLILPNSEPVIQVDQPPIPPIELGRGRRTKRPTWKILERLPQVALPVLDDPQLPEPPLPAPDIESTPAIVWRTFRTTLNAFGIFREYRTTGAPPSHHPDVSLDTNDLSIHPDPSIIPPTTSRCSLAPLGGNTTILPQPSTPDDSPTSTTTLPSSDSPTSTLATPSHAPFANISVWRLMNWMWSGSEKKSGEECNKLVHEVILSPDFKPSDLEGFDVKRETLKLDLHLERDARDGWKESNVVIEVPDGKRHDLDFPDDPPIPTFPVPGLLHRSLVEVIKSVWSDPSASRFHFTPFRQFWQRDKNSGVERIHDELYSSDAFLQAHEDLQRSKPEEGCTLERVVCGLMFWSDSTHLTSFGDASLWPTYLFFGNQSKYVRGRPTSGACHHVAYIPKLPDTFHDFFVNLTKHGPSADILTHCRRELMQGVWRLLLDADFRHAYVHGIAIKCADGVLRRVFPRIFTYAADYPEKVLLATIRNLGACLCPRCIVPKSKVSELGMKRDEQQRTTGARTDSNRFRSAVQTARRAIYKLGMTVKSKSVELLLAAESWVPTCNAFSEFAQSVAAEVLPYEFNFFTMLVPDLMHEFELGVWKAVFTHLIRMLVAVGNNAIQEFNLRYRQMPTFGRFTIRRKGGNTSALKKLAARDYEDYLQCALPVFEGLFPDTGHGKAVMNLLFTLADWHACAKLRMHTDSTLHLLKSATTSLGSQLRSFAKKICTSYDTRELAGEEAARARRRIKAKQAGKAVKDGVQGKKTKKLNLSTYKLHALGDYLISIIFFGTTDSYSTQPGELEHRRVKRFYARTNKNKAQKQIARLQRREEEMRKQGQKKRVYKNLEKKHIKEHHHISPSRNFPSYLPSWLAANPADPALKDFYPKLKDHLLGRLMDPDCADTDTTYSNAQRLELVIDGNRIYRHKTLRVNYTTYDVRRGQDSMKPSNHADVMIPAFDIDPETGESASGHPYIYARIIGIFHASVLRRIPGQYPTIKSMQFLLVRWFRLDTSYHGGFDARRLHRLELLPETDPNAFGFLNPDDVIRGSHIIPGFAYGRVDDESLFYSNVWRYYYVNFFVDRDMYMRYRGLGVGHAFIKAPTYGHPEEDDIEDDSEDEGEIPTGEAEEDVEVAADGGEEDEEEDEEETAADKEGEDVEDVDGPGEDDDDDDANGENEQLLEELEGYDTL